MQLLLQKTKSSDQFKQDNNLSDKPIIAIFWQENKISKMLAVMLSVIC
jgi:hypothetical protein